MANSADRFLQWVSPGKFCGFNNDPALNTAGYTDADLDKFKSWGVDGWIVTVGRPYGMGGGQRLTGNAAEVGTTNEWNLQRRLRDSNIVARCSARGMKVYITAWARSETYIGSFRGYFRDYFNDALWTSTVIPAYAGPAGACQLYGMAGIFFDMEDYPQSGSGTPVGDAARPSWHWDVASSHPPEATVRAKVKQRGAELAAALCGAYPNIELAAYFVRLPLSEYEWATSNADGTPYLNGRYHQWVQVDLLSGLFSTRQLQSFHIADAVHYKFIGPRIGTWSKINLGPAVAYLSQYPGFDWDYAASRLHTAHFVWIDPGETPSEPLRSPAQVDNQLDQASRWSTGGEFYNYAHHWDDTSFDYSPYIAGMVAASTVRTVDSASPTVAVLSSQTVGNNQIISGTSFDDQFIRRIAWRNNQTNASGEAKLTFVDLSGRPMQPFWSGHNNTAGAFDVNDYQTWRVDWTATVPLQLANDSITITAHDIHGLTATVDVTGGDPITPTDKPIVTVNAAASISQTGATLSGTVDPEGAATDARFEYGLTTTYGTQAPLLAMGSGTTPVAISQAISGLTTGTLYHFRLTATNAAGTTVSADGTFTTGSTAVPIVVSDNAASIGQTTVTFTGDVNPQGFATDARFEYGTTTAYGQQTPVVATGSGMADVAMSQDVVSLSAGTLYHFRLTATNLAGTSVTSDRTFTTATAPPPEAVGDRTGPYAAAVLDLPGLRGYWRAGELSGPALDSQGVHTATPTGGITRGITGVPGAGTNLGMSFDGASGRISVPHATTLNLGDGPYSLMAWFKRSAIGSTDAIFDKGSGAYHLYVDADNRVKAGKADFAWGVQSTVTVTDTTSFHFVMVTYDGTSWKLYIDGVDRSGSQSDLTVANAATPLGIGADLFGASGNHFAGVLDELAVGAAVWSAETAADLYELGTTPEQLSAVTGGVEQADTAQPVAVVQSGAAAATAFGLRQTTGGSTLRGTDRLRGATVVTIVVQVGQAATADAVQPASSQRFRLLGQTFDTQTSQVLFRGQRSNVGQASETDSAQTQGYIYTIGQTTETDEAPLQVVSGTPPLVPTRFRSLDFAVDTVVSIAAPKTTVSFTNQVLTAAITPHVLRSDDG